MNLDTMSDNLVAKLAGMISMDTAIHPRDVPEILISFKDLGMINEEQTFVALRNILSEKIIDYAHPFADFMVQNYEKWENYGGESVALKEKEYIGTNYPQILKIIRKDI
jgi:hypothetical protein